MASFSEKEHTINCLEITHCDFSSKWSFAKYFFSGRFLHCFQLAQEWAPDAVEAALQVLDEGEKSIAREDWTASDPMNCASLAAKNLGASEEEMVMVAGFAGGLGLTGGGCGALSAAIWMRSLSWCKENIDKRSFKNPEATQTLKIFEEVTEGRFLCSELSGQDFKSYDQHVDFICRGGCGKLIDTLTSLDK